MTEKGLLIANQTGSHSTSIACRDAYELDESSNARLIQRVNYDIMPCKKMPSPMGTQIRTGVAAPDSLDLSAMPADLTNNIIDCGDATYIVIWVEFAANGDQEITLDPLIFDTTGNTNTDVLGTLEQVYSYCYTGSEPSRNTDGTQQLGLTCSYVKTNGAKRVGIHVDPVYFNVVSTANIWAYVL